VPAPEPGSGLVQYSYDGIYPPSPDTFHNGAYEVTAYYWYAVFDPFTGEVTVYYDWARVYFEIDNLTICDVSVEDGGNPLMSGGSNGAAWVATPMTTKDEGNPLAPGGGSMAASSENDFIIWQPDLFLRPPSINLSLRDTQIGTAWVKLNIYNSNQSPIAGRIFIIPRPTSGIVSVSWDGKDDYGKLAPAGIYLFSLEAIAEGPNYQPPYASDLYRSPWLTIPGLQLLSAKIVASMGGGLKTVRVDYVLFEPFGVPAFSAKVEIFDPGLQLIATAPGGTIVNDPLNPDPVYNSVFVDVPMNKAGTYKVLVSAKDNEITRYKAHWQRPALQNGTTLKVWKVWIDPGHGQNAAGVLHPGCSCNYNRQGHLDPNAPPNKPTGLHKEHTFAYQLATALNANMNNVEPPPGVSNAHIQKLSRDPILPTTKSPKDYEERARLAAKWKADYAICIHLNSAGFTSPVHGHRVFYYSGQTESQQFAQAVNTRLREIQFLRDDDPTRDNNLAPHSHTYTDGTRAILSSYTNLRYTSGRKIVPVLIESVFLTNTQDEDWIAQNQATFVDKIHLGYHDLVGY
jgi:N-acetylmuramoyl-L-alanine amidase